MPTQINLLQAVIDARKARQGAEEFAAATKKMKDAAKGAEDQFEETKRAMFAVEAASNILSSSIRTLWAAFGAYELAQLIQNFVKVNLEFERMLQTMKFATGDAQLSADAFQFVREESNRLGLDLQVAAKGFSRMSAAAKDTSFEGAAVREIFLGIAEASSVLGLSGDQMHGALVAIEQMMNKGKISAEELRGQLAERLPGAFKMGADASKKTIEEFDKLINQGKIMSEDFLLPFAVHMRETFGEDVPDAAKKARAEFNRFFNTLKETAFVIGESGFMSFLANLAIFAEKGIRGLVTLGKALGFLRLEIEGTNIQDMRMHMSDLIDEANDLTESLNDNRATLKAWKEGDFFGELPKTQDEFDELTRAIEDDEKALKKTNEEINVMGERILSAQERMAKMRETAKGVDEALSRLGKSGGDATDALTKEWEKFIKEVERAEAKNELFFRMEEKLVEEMAKGNITREQYHDWLNKHTGFIDQNTEATKRQKEALEDWHEELEEAIDEGLKAARKEAEAELKLIEEAVKRVDDAFVSMWEDVLRDADDAFSALKDVAIRTLAEIIHAYTTRQIVLNIAAIFTGRSGGGGAGPASNLSGGLFSGIGSGLGNALFGGAGGAGFGALFGGGGGAATGFGAGAAFEAGVMPVAGGLLNAAPAAPGLMSAIAGIAVPALIGIGAALVLGGLFGGGSPNIKESQINMGNFPLPGGLPVSGSFTGSPFGLPLSVNLHRLGNEGQLTDEEAQQIIDTIGNVAEVVFALEETIIETMSPEKIDEVVEQLKQQTLQGNYSEAKIADFFQDRFAIVFNALEEGLGETFYQLTAGMNTEEVLEVATAFATVIETFNEGEQIFSDVSSIVDTINILMEDFVREGESMIDTLVRLAESAAIVAQFGFETGTVAGTQFAVDFVDAFGSTGAAATAADAFFAAFYSEEENLQRIMEHRRPGLEERLGGLGFEGIPTREEFRAEYERVRPGLTGDELAEWVKIGNELDAYIKMEERLAELREEQLQTEMDALKERQRLLLEEKAVIEEALQVVRDAIEEVSTSAASFQERMLLDVMDADETYDYWKAKADQALADLQLAEDPEEIRRLWEESMDYLAKAWGTLTPEQKELMYEEFRDLVLDMEEVVLGRLGEREEELVVKIEEVNKKLDEIAVQMLEASLNQLDASALFSEGARIFTTAVANMPSDLTVKVGVTGTEVGA